MIFDKQIKNRFLSKWCLLSRSFIVTRIASAIRRIVGVCYTYQQDNASANRARETVQLLRAETLDFGPDLNPVDHRIWGVMQERVYQKPVRDVEELKQSLVEYTIWR